MCFTLCVCACAYLDQSTEKITDFVLVADFFMIFDEEFPGSIAANFGGGNGHDHKDGVLIAHFSLKIEKKAK